MTEQAAPRADPCACPGHFHDLMTKIRKCKERQTCLSLTSRRYYFEPNPCTAQEWRTEERAYLSGIDARVVFVCESPGKFGAEDQAAPLRCFAKANTWQDKRFREALEKHGYENCYMTNAMKCGVRKGNRHTERELSACRPFLVRELDLLKPLVAVGVGENAYRTLRQDVLPRLRCPPVDAAGHVRPQGGRTVSFQITHFYARRDVDAKWEREFAELKRLLERLKPRSEW